MTDSKTAIEAAITSRRAIRAFLPQPIPQDLVEHILDVAARAPSGTNMQPWRAHVVAGATKRGLSEALAAAYAPRDGAHEAEYKYYPDAFFEPYLGRRRRSAGTSTRGSASAKATRRR